MTSIKTITIILLVALGAAPARAQDAGWQPPRTMLYTVHSPDKQARALRRLGLTKGSWTLFVVRPRCGDCERVAAALGDAPRLVMLVDGGRPEARAWAQKYRLRRARVVVGDDETFNLLGVLELPVVVRIRDGKITGVRKDAP